MANAFSMGRPIEPLVVTAEERAYLERQVRRHRVSRPLSERCRIILRCADGLQSKVVAAELGVHEHTVDKGRRRLLADRIDGLLDEARPGRPRTIDNDQVAAVIERTLRTTPADATHWSIRSMGAETGFAHTTIRWMWNAFGLRPHRSKTFKLWSDPLFVDKVIGRTRSARLGKTMLIGNNDGGDLVIGRSSRAKSIKNLFISMPRSSELTDTHSDRQVAHPQTHPIALRDLPFKLDKLL